MKNIYIVLLENGIVKTVPSVDTLVDPVTILPSEPVSSVTGEPLRELIHNAIVSSAQDGYDALIANLAKDQEAGIEADLRPPPDWLVSLGVWMFQAISAGVAWEFIKVSAQELAERFIKEEAENARHYLDYDRDKAEEAVATYLAKNFANDKSIKDFHDKLVEVHNEHGNEFDWTSEAPGVEDERVLAEGLAAGIIEENKRIQDQWRWRQERAKELKHRIIQFLIEHDLAAEADENLAISVANSIDLYLMNGIETIFLIPSVSPAVDSAIPQIFSKIQIPEEVIIHFHRFQIINDDYTITEYGKKVFRDLAELRQGSQIGPLPPNIFNKE